MIKNTDAATDEVDQEACRDLAGYFLAGEGSTLDTPDNVRELAAFVLLEVLGWIEQKRERLREPDMITPPSL